MGRLTGVELRGWRRTDLRAMAGLINARVDAEGGEDEHVTEDVLAAVYEHLVGCDPDRDITVAVDDQGAIVGYARVATEDLVDGSRTYALAFEGRDGVAAPMFAWARSHAEQLAATDAHPHRRMDAWAADGTERQRVIVASGDFAATSWSAIMVRPGLDAIPEVRLPDGVTIRPVEPDHLRPIWQADVEAFRDHNNEPERDNDAEWARFCHEASAVGLWQIAWDADGVAGQVRTHVTPGEAERRGRRRAWTENISTRRDRRGQGIASALIAASLHQLAELGYEEAALGVDLHNPTGALGVYERLGYQVVQRVSSYACPL